MRAPLQIFFPITHVLLLALLLSACTGNQATPPAAFVQANADRTNVTVRLAGSDQLLPPPETAALQTGDSLQVDEGGRALLRFSDFLTVEVLRQGDLSVRELGVDEQSALAVFGQSGGTFVNELEPGAGAVERRVTVESDFAIITATGTRFMVVKESNSPLEWVFGLDAEADDLTVQAINDPSRTNPTVKEVGRGVARWIAPVGEPSAGIDYDAPAVNAWLAAASRGEAVPEVGTVLWPDADMRMDTGGMDAPPTPGVTMDMGGVSLTAQAESPMGRASYALQDCNGDGIDDVLVRNGVIRLDFRTLLRRVQALDVTLMAGAQPAGGSVAVLDPATEMISRASFEIAPRQGEIVSLRADEPYHYAEITLVNGCFLGFSLLPPGPVNARSEPVPAVDEWPPRIEATPPPAQPAVEPTPTPLYRGPEVTATPPSSAGVEIDGDAGEWQKVARSTRGRWIAFDTIVFDQGCSTRYPYAARSRTDLRARAIFTHDDAYLYVAFVVEDDGFVGFTDQDLRFFLSDAPQLLLDLDLAGDANSPRVNEDDKQIDFRVGIEEPGDSPAIAFWDLGPGRAVSRLLDAPVAAAATETGYFLEAAIPWEVLGIEPVSRLRLGVAVSVSDNDTPGTNSQECMISAAPERDWQNPTTWGVLTLE